MSQPQADPAQKDILIVDDTPANLHLLSEILAEQGYRVRPAPDGPLALAAARAEPPDLVLLDIRMPGMNGYEVCEQLKGDPRTRDIPVIFLSALDATEDKVRGFALGGVDYVTKPFHVEEVLARIQTHLTLRDLQRKLLDANAKMQSELDLAGEVQASFLPSEPPEVPGWQLAVTLRPARETSGDFYDLIPLPKGQLAILVADVADKGVGAALYMVLTWSILRTCIAGYPGQPERVLSVANQRILRDTQTEEFVTAFYGVLDPSTGTLVYGNAGHNPPFLFRKGQEAEGLMATGVPLGIFEDVVWEKRTMPIAEGDVLVLYTDGITEAQNDVGAFFGERQLLESIQAHQGRSAEEIRDALMAAVDAFVGGTPQSDDIALLTIVRVREDHP